jgi:UDP-N-acetylglucosamine 2-epimerase (non-hydrolysing)
MKNKLIKIDLIAGARPNFMKIAPIINEIKKINQDKERIKYRLVHTGQHYDYNMSESFFQQLNIPQPNENLNSGGGSHAEQTAKIMLGYENLLNKEKPDFCLVVGDVTSTMSCSIVAKKLEVKVIHVEGGIRSGDISMPEEINRLVTDSISDYFFTTSKTAGENLLKEGNKKENIFFVGNTMIDSLLRFHSKFTKPKVWEELSLIESNYIVLTLHRPSNVDKKNKLNETISSILKSAKNIPVVFPAHPRTATMLNKIQFNSKNLKIINPLSYLEFNYLVEKSLCVVTDSGGITEETTVLNIPCMTLRDSTERPETIDYGTNVLLGTDSKKIPLYFNDLFNGKWKKTSIPPLWDGNAAERIVKTILSF